MEENTLLEGIILSAETEDYGNVLGEQDSTLLENDSIVLGICKVGDMTACTRTDICICDTEDACLFPDTCTKDSVCDVCVSPDCTQVACTDCPIDCSSDSTASSVYYMAVWAAYIYGKEKPTNNYCTYRLPNASVIPTRGQSSSYPQNHPEMFNGFSRFQSGTTTYFWKSGTTTAMTSGYNVDDSASGTAWFTGHMTSGVVINYGMTAHTTQSYIRKNPAIVYGQTAGSAIRSVYLCQGQYKVLVTGPASHYITKAGYRITIRQGTSTGALRISGYTAKDGYCTFVTSAQNLYYATVERPGSMNVTYSWGTPPLSGGTYNCIPTVSADDGYCLITEQSARTYNMRPWTAAPPSTPATYLVLTEKMVGDMGNNNVLNQCLSKYTYGHYYTDDSLYLGSLSANVFDETITYESPEIYKSLIPSSIETLASTSTITNRGSGWFTATVAYSSSLDNRKRFTANDMSWSANSELFARIGTCYHNNITAFMKFRWSTAGTIVTRYFQCRAYVGPITLYTVFSGATHASVNPFYKNITIPASNKYGVASTTANTASYATALSQFKHPMTETYNGTDLSYGIINSAKTNASFSTREGFSVFMSAYTGSFTVTAQTAYAVLGTTENNVTLWYKH